MIIKKKNNGSETASVKNTKRVQFIGDIKSDKYPATIKIRTQFKMFDMKIHLCKQNAPVDT